MFSVYVLGRDSRGLLKRWKLTGGAAILSVCSGVCIFCVLLLMVMVLVLQLI